MSREMDVEVAEKVMGWSFIQDREIGPIGWRAPDGTYCLTEPPSYSTDIAAAFSLVGLGDHFMLERSLIHGVWRWECAIMRRGAERYSDTVKSDTAPMAISLAALATLNPTSSSPAERP